MVEKEKIDHRVKLPDEGDNHALGMQLKEQEGGKPTSYTAIYPILPSL
jgi:hypothetical protein